MECLNFALGRTVQSKTIPDRLILESDTAHRQRIFTIAEAPAKREA